MFAKLRPVELQYVIDNHRCTRCGNGIYVEDGDVACYSCGPLRIAPDNVDLPGAQPSPPGPPRATCERCERSYVRQNLEAHRRRCEQIWLRVACDGCGREFLRSRGRLAYSERERRDAGQFCSRECATKYGRRVRGADIALRPRVAVPPPVAPPPKPVEGARHGTITGYTRDKCRCSECRLVMRDYNRKRRARAREVTP